jgi:hypothetical protein
MNICDMRIKVYQERIHLLNLPQRSIKQEARLEWLNKKWERFKLCGDVRSTLEY